MGAKRGNADTSWGTGADAASWEQLGFICRSDAMKGKRGRAL